MCAGSRQEDSKAHPVRAQNMWRPEEEPEKPFQKLSMKGMHRRITSWAKRACAQGPGDEGRS